ncbi:MAG TPA: hypothetical protein VEA99_01160 [Gemmatimonadaceae bacterium]|nr:hypothetical protein [Gemmatimonadaceae bacterium]
MAPAWVGVQRFAGATRTFTAVRRLVQATGISFGTIDGTLTIP